MLVRRVVTGHDGDGRAVFVSDVEVDGQRPALIAGSEFHRLWRGDQPPRFPDGGEAPEQPGDTVVQNGTRHRWSNRADLPATLAVFIVGAHHDAVG